MSSSIENPPAYAPVAAAHAPTSDPVWSTFAVRVKYVGCAPRNAMVSMPASSSSSSSEEHGSCLEARIDTSNSIVTLIVTARHAEIAHYCKHIADELHGTIRSCKRITTKKQRRAALRPHDSESESESESESDSEVDRLTRSITGTSSGGNWLIDATKLIVIALIAYMFGSR